MLDYPKDLVECARAMVKRHGANARSVAKVFSDAQAIAGNEEMAAFWKAVTEAIQKAGAADALTLPTQPARASVIAARSSSARKGF
jgi:hypothetical protein